MKIIKENNKKLSLLLAILIELQKIENCKPRENDQIQEQSKCKK